MAAMLEPRVRDVMLTRTQPKAPLEPQERWRISHRTAPHASSAIRCARSIASLPKCRKTTWRWSQDPCILSAEFTRTF